MKQLVFATGNPNKVKEVMILLGDRFEIKSLKDLGCHEDIPETSDTFAGNALLKAQYVKTHYQQDCFSEDTGLEVESLQGEPGVYSARYAGADRDAQQNMDLVLQRLQNQPNRKAQFRTVIALIWEGETYLFEGIVKGTIALTKSGSEGFGYDPIFVPEGYDKCFAEMTTAEKNVISHRGRAMKKLLAFLQKQL
ncbi:MAG: non-canonical purine NTP diphosphatase [Saprospiraceae bacterium]